MPRGNDRTGRRKSRWRHSCRLHERYREPVSKELRYSERIFPSLGATLSLAALISSMTFAIWAALGLVIASSFAATATLFALLWWIRAIHTIEVSHDWLRVNDAKVTLQHLGELKVLTPNEWKCERGVNFDPGAYHAHRFWNKTGLKIQLRDERDPHNAWVIASKNPETLAKFLASD